MSGVIDGRAYARPKYDAVVVGAGPNGLSAAITLARAKLSTLLIEAHATPGGGARTQELTLPGFLHDVCSTVHPLGVASPFFRTLDLAGHGLQWIFPPAPLAHVLADGRAVMLEKSVTDTAAELGPDGTSYESLFRPFVERCEPLLEMVLGPLRWPSAPLLLARFGMTALGSLERLAHARFKGEAARALLAGMSAHAMQPLAAPATAAFALILGLTGHAIGWPIARGGSQAIIRALSATLRELGGELRLNQRVTQLAELPSARAYLFDLTPRQVLQIAGGALPARYRQRLARFRYGPGVFKMDWALSAPIPWRDSACARAATVHLSGSLEDIARAESAVQRGRVSNQPFVIVVQPSLFDASRAPAGLHTAWAYCHVPHGSEIDLSRQIERQIERFAPGFATSILARASKAAPDMERYNENYVGGDINGGAATLRQLFTRPLARIDPYATPSPNLFICSSSTPPGGGVHGMCGYWAAQSALRGVFGGKGS
ncbi:MAG TPA: NAD(P)/FAD-dependent oxidoreductase [Polyangiaceae bacterium]|nr:NAD(P)/FAD-dependent oxidoreductase [Polyangiaceae bacterium]